MRLTIIFFILLLCCSSRVYADESPVSPRMDKVQSVDSIESSIEQRNILDYDPTRRSIFPPFINRFRSYREELNKKIRLEALFSYDILTQGYASDNWSEGAASGGERYLVRLAVSDGDTTSVDQLVTLGWGRPFRKYDHLGLGLGMGRSAADSSRYQGVAETYYRWQVTKELLITPDLQIIAGKGTDDGEDFQIVVGLRGGFTF